MSDLSEPRNVEILLNESLTLTVEGKVVEETEDTPDETEVAADDR